MKKRAITFEQAKAQYVHRFTCEHVPAWARYVRPDGTYYAPQYATDREWYNNTVFPDEFEAIDQNESSFCYSRNETWPCGKTLSAPYVRKVPQ